VGMSDNDDNVDDDINAKKGRINKRKRNKRHWKRPILFSIFLPSLLLVSVLC